MSQSQSLIAALEAVERILSAKTGDLKKLAEIAGIVPETLYRRADLSGIDLRNQDINFLLPLDVQYLGAKLTEHQERTFRKAEREAKKEQVSKFEQDERVQLARQFITDFIQSGQIVKDKLNGIQIDSDILELCLIEPLHDYNRTDSKLKPTYINEILVFLYNWIDKNNVSFFISIFKYFNVVKAPVDSNTVSILEKYRNSELDVSVGELIAAFSSNEILDTYWIIKEKFLDVYIAASEIGKLRPVNTSAIEFALAKLGPPSEFALPDTLRFFTDIPIDCNNDQAERLATYVTRSEWAADQTERVLESRVPLKMRTAIFRQLLAQGNEGRVVEVIRWLNGQRGAVGALTLDNAFSQMKDFNLALSLAQEIVPYLSDNQTRVIELALKSIATDSREIARLDSFWRAAKGR